MTNGSSVEDPSEPATRKPGFRCPRCGKDAQQDWATLRAGGQQFPFRDDDTRVDYVPGVAPTYAHEWTVSRCYVCNTASVWRGSDLAFPQRSTIPPADPAMPESVRGLYDEARAVAPISRRAAAALARATLEQLLKELRPSTQRMTLDERLLAIHGEVSSGLWQLLAVVRHTGNKALHGGDSDDEVVALVLSGDAEIMEALFEAVNGVVDELQVKPTRRQEIYLKIPEQVRDRVERLAARDLG